MGLTVLSFTGRFSESCSRQTTESDSAAVMLLCRAESSGESVCHLELLVIPQAWSSPKPRCEPSVNFFTVQIIQFGPLTLRITKYFIEGVEISAV